MSVRMLSLLFATGICIFMSAAEEYQYRLNNAQIGSEQFEFADAVCEGIKAVDLKCRFNVGDAASFQKGESQFWFTDTGRPLRYERTIHVQLPGQGARNGNYEMQYVFSEKQVKVTAKKDGQMIVDRTFELEPGTPLLDNNALSLFGVICKNFLKDSPQEKSVNAFHAATLQIMEVKFVKAGEKTSITIGEKSYQTDKYKVTLGNIPIGFFYITADGLLVRDDEPRQRLVVDLIE